MDTICGLGLPELVILALLGFVVIGPERSHEVALKTGRFLRSVMTSTWWREFNQVAQAIRDMPTTLVRMAEIEETQAELRQAMSDIQDSTQVDFSQPAESGAITDPWGIRNAVAGTRVTPRTPPPSSSSDESSESSPPTSTDETPDA